MSRFALPSALALFFVSVVVTSVRADMSAPGTQRAHPSHRIIATEDFPNHVFVIYRPRVTRVEDKDTGKYVEQDAGEAEYVEPTPNRPIAVEYDHNQRVVVLIIARRAVAGSYKSARELADAVQSQQVEDAVEYHLSNEESVPAWQGREITIVHRIQRSGTSNRLEVVRTTRHQGYQCCVACLLYPITTVLGGFWLVQWRRRRWKIPSMEAPAPTTAPLIRAASFTLIAAWGIWLLGLYHTVRAYQFGEYGDRRYEEYVMDRVLPCDYATLIADGLAVLLLCLARPSGRLNRTGIVIGRVCLLSVVAHALVNAGR